MNTDATISIKRSTPNPTLHKESYTLRPNGIYPDIQEWFNIYKSICIMYNINNLRKKTNMIILINE